MSQIAADQLRSNLEASAANPAMDEGNITIDSPIEITGEVQLHHAFRLAGVPVRLVLGAGALFRVARTDTTDEFAEFVDPACDPSMGRCQVAYSTEVTENVEYRVLPNLRAEIGLGGLALSYTATLDVDNIEDTTHSLGIGFTF